MKKLFKIYFNVFKMSLMSQMAFRENFLIWCIVHTVHLATMVVFIGAVFSRTQAINGWTQDQSLLLVGIGTLIGGIGSLTFFSFMYDFGRKILKGEFDSVLTKPYDTLFASAFSWVDVEDIMTIPNSLFLIFYALSRIAPQNLWLNIITFIFLLVCSMFILFSILILIQSLAFKHVRVHSAIDFYWATVGTAKYPAKAMRGISVLVWVMVFPIALISSVPAEVLFGRYDWPWIISSIVLSFSLFIFSRWVFYQSLKSYSSASS